MSTNVQVRVFTGISEEDRIETIDSGSMQIKGREGVIYIPVHEGVLENGIIKEAKEEVEENRR